MKRLMMLLLAGMTVAFLVKEKPAIVRYLKIERM